MNGPMQLTTASGVWHAAAPAANLSSGSLRDHLPYGLLALAACGIGGACFAETYMAWGACWTVTVACTGGAAVLLFRRLPATS